MPILGGGGPFAAARAADPFFSFSGRGGAGGQMTPVAQQGVALDFAADSGALPPPPAARVRLDEMVSRAKPYGCYERNFTSQRGSCSEGKKLHLLRWAEETLLESLNNKEFQWNRA